MPRTWDLDVRHPWPDGGGTTRASQVPGEPSGGHALLFDPGGTFTPGQCGVSVLPSAILTASAPTITLLSGLNHTAYPLPVYASPRALPHATQHSVPAAGLALPGGIGYPLGSIRRFRCLVPPSPGFPGAPESESLRQRWRQWTT